MSGLGGKVAIVTGASSGIGLAVARKLAAEGVKVALVARTKDKLEEAARGIGDGAAVFPLDVTDLKALAELPGRVVERFGGLDIVVNNAGLNHRGPIKNHTAQQLADVITTNLSAPIVLTRAAADHLRPGGAIVNVASLAGMVPVPNSAPYSASKAGLRAFARAMADELPGVRVATVSPGPVNTGFFGEDISKVPNLVFSQPMSTADEVADQVLRCIVSDVREVAMPRLSGALATVGYVFPNVMRLLRPLMEKRGAKNKERYIQRLGR